jgi:hypothetical protein
MQGLKGVLCHESEFPSRRKDRFAVMLPRPNRIKIHVVDMPFAISISRVEQVPTPEA